MILCVPSKIDKNGLYKKTSPVPITREKWNPMQLSPHPLPKLNTMGPPSRGPSLPSCSQCNLCGFYEGCFIITRNKSFRRFKFQSFFLIHLHPKRNGCIWQRSHIKHTIFDRRRRRGPHNRGGMFLRGKHGALLSRSTCPSGAGKPSGGSGLLLTAVT